MTTSFVGLENLPNVYFRDIKISPSNGISGPQGVSSIQIKLVVKDTKIDGKFQWVSDDLLSTYLNVKVLQSFDKSLTEEISTGQYTLEAFDYSKFPEYDSDLVSTKIKRIRVTEDPEQYSVGDNIYEFEYVFLFEILNANLIDVAYFACISLDLDMLATNFSANFDDAQIKYFQGPISSEKVFVDGILQTRTNLFYLPDNQIWSGPVHLHEGGYMAGAFHTTNPHPPLRLVEIQNLKLKDNRDIGAIEKKLTNRVRSSFIGTPYDSVDEYGNVKRLLSLNIEGIFLEKTKYGSIIKRIDSQLYKDTISEFTINKMIINRKFVKTARNKKSFTIYHSKTQRCLIYQDNNEDTTVETDGSIIHEITSNNNKYRYFNFVDKQIKSFKYGKYIHAIDISFIDKTKNLLLSLLRKYRDDINLLDRYYFRSTKNKYKTKNDSFTKEFFENEYQKYNLNNSENSRITPWLNAPENYSNLNAYIYSLSDDEKQNIYEKTYASINPDTGTSKAISEFIENYKNLVSIFNKKFQIDDIKSGTFENKIVPTKNGQANPTIHVRIKKDYNEIFTPSPSQAGYRIFDVEQDEESNGILTLTREDFNSRRIEEKNRFFKADPNLNFEESKNLDEEEIESLVDIETYSTSYFSPMRFVMGSRRIDLRQTNITNNRLLNNTIDAAILSKNKKIRTNKKSIFTKNVSINKLKSASNKNTSNDKQKSFENASEYLGSSSKFLDMADDFAIEDLNVVEKILVKEKFLTSKNKKTKRKLIKNFDLTKKDNVIFKKKRASKSSSKIDKKRKLSKKYKSELRKIPNHLKAMITSRSSVVRTNLLSSVKDLLASEEQNNALLIQHFAVKQIEYLDGFKKDKMGKEIFNLPNWRRLDLHNFKQSANKILICRASQYIDEILELELPAELDFQLFDKYFIILPDTQPDTQQAFSSFASETASQLSQQNEINYDYATTNPVMQPAKENGIFTEQPDPNKEISAVNTSSRNQSITSRQRRSRSTSRSRY